MNKLIKNAAAAGLALFSVSAFAEKFVITGQPIILEKNGEIYVVPQQTKLTRDFQYVTIDGKSRACFLDKRPDFVNLDVVSINVKVGTDTASWNCYSLDPTHFVIEPSK